MWEKQILARVTGMQNENWDSDVATHFSKIIEVELAKIPKKFGFSREENLQFPSAKC